MKISDNELNQASYKELICLLKQIKNAINNKKPIGIKCYHCKEIFPLNENNSWSDKLYTHYRRVEKYPREDASLSCGDKEMYVYE